jgi:xanthine dehydrogenase YagR molybdenum-binding subunit
VLAAASSQPRTFVAFHISPACVNLESSSPQKAAGRCTLQRALPGVPMNAPTIGPSRNRVDGRLKVTGAAKYAVEFAMPNCLQAWPVESNIAKGKITAIDTKAAEAIPGVAAVLTHLNAPKLNNPIGKEERSDGSGGIRNEQRFPLADTEVHYAGQYVALVIAETLEQARHAANHVGVTYAPETPVLTMEAAQRGAEKPRKNKEEPLQVNKGDVAAAMNRDDLTWAEAYYSTPTETHNPIEMSGTIAVWEADDKLVVYDTSQFVKGVQDVLSRAFGLQLENVRVISPFVGGAFGCKGAVWPHVLLAAMGAKATGAPVKFHLPRKHMFTGTGHRTPTRQHLLLLASKDGKLQAMQHITETQTSTVGDFTESCGVRSTGLLYDCPSIKIEERIFPVNIATPTFMRAPGECPGTFALESAMDELAYELKMDPVELRIINDAANHPTKEVPFSAKFLKEAYARGAEKFGWAKRDPKPGSLRDGDVLVGWGMATCTYPAHKMSAAAKVQFRADGTATVQCATHDLGTGAYTAFTQISSEQLGIPFENVTFELGKSDFPFGPVAGGSNSTGTVGTAIHEAAKMFHRSLAELAVQDTQSPLHGGCLDDVAMVVPGRIGLTSDPTKSDSYVDILKRAGRESIDVESEFKAPDKNKDLGVSILRRAFLRGPHRPDAAAGAGEPRRQRHQRRTDREWQNRAQPDHRRCRHGHRHGVDGRDGLRPRDGIASDAQSRRLPRANDRRHSGHRRRVHRGAGFRLQPTRRARAWGNRRHRDRGRDRECRCITPPACGCATCRSRREIALHARAGATSVKELADIISAWQCRRGERFALATLVRRARLQLSPTRSAHARVRRRHDRRLVERRLSRGGSRGRAREVMRTGAPALMEFDTRRRFGCNGAIEIFVEAAREQFLAELADSFQQRRSITAVTVFGGDDTAVSGTRMLNPGETAPDGAFVQEITAPIQLVIFGEGPDSAPLRSFAQILGWQVIETDRAETLPLDLDARTAAIVKSHNYGRDFTALQRLLQLDLRYVGLLGPRKRRDQLLGDLLDVGVPLNAELFSPAGFDLRAETPQEIALAIVAEIQAVFAESSGESLRDRKAPIHGWNVAPARTTECETSAR